MVYISRRITFFNTGTLNVIKSVLTSSSFGDTSYQYPRQNDYRHFYYLFSRTRRSRRGLSRFLLKVLTYLARLSANSSGNNFRGEWSALPLGLYHHHHPILGNLLTVMMLNEGLQLLKLCQS